MGAASDPTAHSKSNSRAEAWGSAVPFSPCLHLGGLGSTNSWTQFPKSDAHFRRPRATITELPDPSPGRPQTHLAGPLPAGRWTSAPRGCTAWPCTFGTGAPAWSPRASSWAQRTTRGAPTSTRHGLVAATARTPWTTVRRAPATRARSTTTRRR